MTTTQTLRDAAQAVLREQLDIIENLSRDEFENDAAVVKHCSRAVQDLFAALAAPADALAEPASIDDVRRKFEEWYDARQMPAEANWFVRDTEDPDEYAFSPTQDAWEGFAGAMGLGVDWWGRKVAATQLHQAVERARTEEREACAAERNRWEWIVAHWTKADANFHRKGPKEGQLKGLVLTISTEDKGQGGSPHLANVIDDAIRARGTTK